MSPATRITVSGVRSSCEASRVKLCSRSTKRPMRLAKPCSEFASVSVSPSTSPAAGADPARSRRALRVPLLDLARQPDHRRTARREVR
jgi:hypothetical protein